MALSQTNVVDRIEVIENGIVQVRTANRIMDGQTQLAENFARHCIAPGDDYSKEDAKVQAICQAVHTPEVVAQYQAAQEANKPQV